MTAAAPSVDPLALQAILSRHLPIYRKKVPHYQAYMLESLQELWVERHKALLDVGGGTGVIAEAIARLLPVDHVQAIDLVDRFCSTLSIKTARYDGRMIPFADGSFDAATLNNVLHHVPVGERVDLLREIRRVVNGPLYIKDHVSTGRIDDVRLTTLDAIGNLPFGGMIEAKYLSPGEWTSLAASSGWRVGQTATPREYRSGFVALAFPNRLETTMRFEPA